MCITYFIRSVEKHDHVVIKNLNKLNKHVNEKSYNKYTDGFGLVTICI